MLLIAQLSYLLLNSFCQIIIGYKSWSLTLKLLHKLKLTKKSEALALNPIPNYILGLLIHLTAILLLKSLGLAWIFACLLPLAPALISKRLIKETFKNISITPSINFSLWFLVIFFIGLSILQTHDGIQTIWANNYGDATFHLGMISSFTFGDNFPPELHIFAGESLSYPLFMNLWTASIWWINPSYYSLALIWLIQWLICWCLVFHLLKGERNQLLPWAVLFAGGTYSYIFDVLKDPGTMPAHSFIDKGKPWTPFLTTIWIPQRTTQLGLLTTLAPLSLFHRALKDSAYKLEDLALAALILAFSVLSHTHFLLASTVYMLLILLIKVSCEKEFKEISVFILCLIPGLTFLPFVASKEKAFSIMYGWMPLKDLSSASSITGSLLMWAENAPFFLLTFVILWLVSKKRANLLAMTLIFVAANFFVLAFWEWDQIKIFIALYLITLSFWSSLESDISLRAQILSVALVIPGLFETCRVLKKPEDFTIYTKVEMAQAEEIKKLTKPGAIILAKPDHNSPITLTGRKLYYGYEGTLWSHGIVHEERKNSMGDIENLLNSCNEENCPNYLYWSDREKAYWKDLRTKGIINQLEISSANFLYKIK